MSTSALNGRIRVNVTHEAGFDLAFVFYRNAKTAKTVQIAENVNIDYACNGDVVAIELLALEDEDLTVKREFAAAHDLVFPSRTDRVVTEG